MQTMTATRPVRPHWQHKLEQPRRCVRPFTKCVQKCSAIDTASSQAGQRILKGDMQPTRRLINGALLLGVPISLLLQGAANGTSTADTIKTTDPSIDTVNPPKIGDAVESRAKVAGSTLESPPPSDLGGALKEGVTRMEVPDPMKTVLPGKNSGFNVLDQVTGEKGPKKPNAVRDTIVDKALTEQSPKRNFEK